MTYGHTLPEINVRNHGSARVRKKASIPSRHPNIGSGNRLYSDVVVGGVLWLVASGMTQVKAAQLIGTKPKVVSVWVVGSQRPHVTKRQPDEVFWSEVRRLTQPAEAR